MFLKGYYHFSTVFDMHITLVFIVHKKAPEESLYIYLTVSQDISAHLAMRARMEVLSQPSVALALFSLHLDNPLVTPAHQVIEKAPVHWHACVERCTMKQR